jgi:urease accessory protein UreF
MTQEAVIQESAQLLGEYPALLQQLGPGGAEAAAATPSSLWREPFQTPEALEAFLKRYHDEVMATLELPTILRAAEHTRRNEGRELIALDRSLNQEAVLKDFAVASRRVGRLQLRRLRPLKDHRAVQKYLAASDEGRVAPWHTVVYGVTLGVYNIPLRQGLAHYAQHTLGSWVDVVRDARRFPAQACTELLDRLLPSTLAAMERALAAQAKPSLTIS